MQLSTLAATAAVFSAASLAAGQVVVLESEAIVEYGYGYGGASAGPVDGNTVAADNTNGGGFGGGGSGVDGDVDLSLLMDPNDFPLFNLNFDLSATGLAANAEPVDVKVELQFKDVEGGAANDNSIILTEFVPFDGSLTNIDITYDATSPDTTYDAGDLALLASLIDGGDLDDLNVNINFDPNVPLFGSDNDNQFTFGTVTVTQSAIPEPASLGLIGLAGLALVRRR